MNHLPVLVIDDCDESPFLGGVKEASDRLALGQWQRVSYYLDQTISGHLKLRSWMESDGGSFMTLDPEPSDLVSKATLLLEAGKLWNRFLQFHKAKRCFEAAHRIHKSFPFCDHERQIKVDATFCHMYTRHTLGEYVEALAVFDRRSQTCGFDDSSRSKLQHCVIELADSLRIRLSFNEAQRLLSDRTIFFTTQPNINDFGPNSWQQTFHARRKSIFARLPQLLNASEHYSSAVSCWEQLGWPLDETHIIMETLFAWEFNSLEENVGHWEPSKEVPPAGTSEAMCTIVKLYDKYWRHCGQKIEIVKKLHSFAEYALNENNGKNALGYCDMAFKILRDDSPCEERASTMWTGMLLYVKAMAHWQCDQMDESHHSFKKCISLLIKSTKASFDCRTNESVMVCLARAYDSLAEVLLDHFGNAAESVAYRRKCIEHGAYIDEETLTRARTLVADSLHHRTAVLQQEGQQEEAVATAREAEEIFEQTIAPAPLSAFEHIVYGYFLYRQERYRKALDVLQRAQDISEEVNSTIIFYQHEIAILTDELRHEVENSEAKRLTIPGIFAALYFRFMCFLKMRNQHRETTDCVDRMATEVITFDFLECAENLNSKVEHLQYGAYCLLGYSYRTLRRHEEAIQAFTAAQGFYATQAARINISRESQMIMSETT